MSFPYYQDYPQTLIDANSVASFDVTSQWVACYKAAEEFDLSIGGGPFLKFNQGLQINWGALAQVSVRLRPIAGAVTFPNAVTLRFGVGTYVDARFSVSAPLQISAGAIIQPKSPANLSTGLADSVLVAATSVQIFAANAAARCRRVTNLGTVNVRVSATQADVDAGRGEVIQPGECREIFVTGQIWARSTGTPTLNRSEEVF